MNVILATQKDSGQKFLLAAFHGHSTHAEDGGRLQFSELTVGFKKEKPDLKQSLPNIENPSDHYPVGATLSLL